MMESVIRLVEEPGPLVLTSCSVNLDELKWLYELLINSVILLQVDGLFDGHLF